EELYNNDPTNWWLPNHAALPAMMRSAGLRVIARPHSHVLIAEPERYLGKVAYDKLVFPRYGKRDGALHPGPQEVDAALWAELEGQAGSSGGASEPSGRADDESHRVCQLCIHIRP